MVPEPYLHRILDFPLKPPGFVEFADHRGFDSAMRMREEMGENFLEMMLEMARNSAFCFAMS